MQECYQFLNTIDTEEELRELIGYPGELINNKVIHHLDSNCIEFISKSPFLTISTSEKSGFCDVSPRGDDAGFVKVLNDRQLIIPERPGNKRADSLRNIISNPKVGLLFFIPGLGETLRVNGNATIIKDEVILNQLIAKGKTPLLAIAVEVDECYVHCAKAFIRSGLWDPESWADKKQLPTAAKMIFEHARQSDTTVYSIEKRLKESYSKRLY
ncbi:pyridoxamine 5'-phosphate oxidase family protein [Gracilibacillus oryzae]|uniref:Pyridoxamine 5'-phosphate oxidase family protein n=1 Tax=Gracilibacillus oryzae TaxID=1672701 RepID=A0A7C8KQ53_9BACI|nr:pyridoxamine 5'-phosphate oxidase family protein [Gracilibacillus oryzae]KAB8126660.1 pyridoxamine 5'-phosphate oxidase family protein [Gracilibacillus oryzae]